MKRQLEAFGAGLSLALVVTAGCSGNGAEDQPASESTASAAAGIILGEIVNTEDVNGNEIGVYTYTSPFSRETNGSYGPHAVIGLICQTEGRNGADHNVPTSPEPVRWSTWVLAAEGYNHPRTQRWIPRPFVEPEESLDQCPPGLITP